MHRAVVAVQGPWETSLRTNSTGRRRNKQRCKSGLQHECNRTYHMGGGIMCTVSVSALCGLLGVKCAVSNMKRLAQKQSYSAGSRSKSSLQPKTKLVAPLVVFLLLAKIPLVESSVAPHSQPAQQAKLAHSHLYSANVTSLPGNTVVVADLGADAIMVQETRCRNDQRTEVANRCNLQMQWGSPG